MQIKLQLGRLQLRLPLAGIIKNQQMQNGIQILLVRLTHVLALQTLPLYHSDPFDRLLIAQAIVGKAKLVSADTAFPQYPVSLIW